MKKEWNKNNIIKVLLWTLAYAVLSILVMELGSIHPVFFVLYPVVSAIVLPIPYLMAAKRVKAFGVPTVMTLVFALIVFAVGEMASYRWFVFIPMIVLAEGARALFGYDSKKGLGISAFIMSFSTFAWAFPIWFMHDFTISEAVKEMPAGYAETLDAVSPMWTLPVVLIGALLVGAGCIWFYLKKFVKTDTPVTTDAPATKEA